MEALEELNNAKAELDKEYQTTVKAYKANFNKYDIKLRGIAAEIKTINDKIRAIRHPNGEEYD